MKSRVTSASLTLVLLLGLFIVAATEAKKVPPARPLDINSATVEQLTQVPGIGPTTAQAIVSFREKSSPFKRVEDLLAIHGISRQKLDQMRPYVTVVPAQATRPK